MIIPDAKSLIQRDPVTSQYSNSPASGLNWSDIAEMAIGVATVAIAILALFKSWKCLKGRKNAVGPLHHEALSQSALIHY